MKPLSPTNLITRENLIPVQYLSVSQNNRADPYWKPCTNLYLLLFSPIQMSYEEGDPRSIVASHYEQTYEQVDQQIGSARQLLEERRLRSQQTPERPYPRRPKNRVYYQIYSTTKKSTKITEKKFQIVFNFKLCTYVFCFLLFCLFYFYYVLLKQCCQLVLRWWYCFKITKQKRFRNTHFTYLVIKFSLSLFSFMAFVID